jgi:hypothetical protein
MECWSRKFSLCRYNVRLWDTMLVSFNFLTANVEETSRRVKGIVGAGSS